MTTGAFYPAPFRLIADGSYGLSAEHHARLCNDLVAVSRVLPGSAVIVNVTTLTVTSHVGMYSNALKPTVEQIATGHFRLTWLTEYELYEQSDPVIVNHAKASLLYANAGGITVMKTAGSDCKIDVYTWDAAGSADNLNFSARVWL